MPDPSPVQTPPAVRIRGFAPLARPDARVLILGSMPSRESLAQHRYYAHPRNAFWPIITSLLTIDAEGYEDRVHRMTARGIAVWDVLRDCVRPGSLDSNIDEKTAVANDFSAFFDVHPGIRRIFFNGAKAESVYHKRILPSLPANWNALARQRLPSTSPAHAGMSLDQKRAAWRAILTPLQGEG
ncbi:MAG: DNA-deoxyinosine glycosylase [Xanthomonadales bacterium]|nr:DNA-deoxyinosine glycosylase [Gammaproteobacteria bacterium]MBT8051325.1 DNA-deoxyinosine glycosylase [Gammaproteobacteria bacterium]MBT8057340.1 DNA-deoxyinosine glycosylase [Gammaproteobacteria bacterium]NNJ77773.1 DNA-deoxyinosine glycosylase [Xanthomonadales bacterium]NNL04688.1 DNA-deoxyinosine glycosylase [Xanthomonadales bacterium]